MDKVYCSPIPFCNATQQHQAAIDAGKPARSIYVEGRGAETFNACISQFRHGGTLGLVGGLRVIGQTRVIIMDRLRELRKRNIIPYNLDTGNRDQAELLNEAISKINGARALKENPRHAQRIGRAGGTAKGIAAADRRDEIMKEEIIARICTAPELSWKRRAEILGGKPFSESTIRRLYGDR
jgi:hypothetical protein